MLALPPPWQELTLEAEMDHRTEFAAPPLEAEEARRFLELADRLFEKMIQQQRDKVLRLAREAVPTIGPEDVLNPHDFPQLAAHPGFEYEDGILAGLVAAQIAVRAEIKQSARNPGARSG